MSGIARGIAIAVILAGLFATVHPQTAKPASGGGTSCVPVPVCPPHDPNACHIDQW